MLRKTILFWIILALAGCESGAASRAVPAAPTHDPRLPYPIPGSCPQTNAAPSAVLPAGLGSAADFWIGERTIFAGHVDGPAWHSGENSVLWWSMEGQPALEVRMIEGRRAGKAVVKFQSPAPPLYPSLIVIPVGGCWEITATTASHKLIFLAFAYPSRVTR